MGRTVTTEPTYAERLDFVFEMVRLQLWFLRARLADHADDTVADVLRRRIDIYRQTDLHDGRRVDQIDFDQPRWLELEQQLGCLYERTQNDEDSTRFEAEGLAIFAERIEVYIRRRYEAGWNAAIRRMFADGCLRFDPPTAEHPRCVFIHIANVVSPASIFDDAAYLPRCLRGVIDRARAANGAEGLQTATWLNSYGRWLAAFPAEWAEHMEPPMTEITCGMGWWGQFINAAGTFNHKRGRQFRRSGQVPYPPRGSWCSLAALEKHLSGPG